MNRRALLAIFCMLAAGCLRDAPPASIPIAGPDGAGLVLHPAFTGFVQPVLLTHDGISGESYVVEQGGRVWRLKGEARELWLDLSDSTRAGGERGLLGLAFEPNGDRAYVTYTDLDGNEHLGRVHADLRRERILQIEEPYSNHNGGHLAFGPDGLLYYGLGDGGSSGDPQGNGQDPHALLGSLLRLDVSGVQGYEIPADNAWREAWAKGLRNPWRFSFDRETGDLYIADVGQNQWEEVNFLAAGTPSGTNFGWNVFEGTHRFKLIGDTFSPHTPPVAEYSHAQGGCSITGGHVYRGGQSADLAGVYLFGDYCSGKIWGMREMNGAWNVIELLDTDLAISSFGEDAEGELYVVDHKGGIYHIRAGEIPEALKK